MPTRRSVLICAGLLALGARVQATLPAGFISEPIGSGWADVVGLAFGKNGDGTRDRMYVWERSGRVWIMENGQKLPTPLIDIAEEVGGWRDHGMLGFALDPNFQQNGHIYLFYAVDRHHLFYHGTAQYNPAANSYNAATIGRITRYTCTKSSDFRTVDPASRRVLLGESKSTGIPLLHESHSVGMLVFGSDGTLLASCGDGASYNAVDAGGGAGGAYGNQAVADGIMPASHNIGSFRSQLLDSLNGKIVRIDPANGDGVPGNPYYDPTAPRSVPSRVWASGVRNTYRMTLRPGTGSHNFSAGNPGVLFMGDVGWTSREELNVADRPGLNFGWPLYEGMDAQAGYQNARPPSVTPPVHQRPAFDWRTGVPARAFVDGTIFSMSGAGNPVSGPSFGGTASTGGTWYTGTDFPPEFQNSYFHSDYTVGWIRCFKFDENNRPLSAQSFGEALAPVVFLASHPEKGGLYYIAWGQGVHKISYAPGGNQAPLAVADANRTHGPGPLTVQFFGHHSNDPENSPLTYQWNFGDGGTSTEMNPTHTFAGGAGPLRYNVTLTVRDASNVAGSATLVIGVNHAAPIVRITSPPDGLRYPINQGDLTYPLTAEVTDEAADTALAYQWQVFLHHNEHEHGEPVDTAHASSVVISPHPCTATDHYFYRIVLKVTDPLGLVTTAESDVLPDCGTQPVVTYSDAAACYIGGSQLIAALDNDRGAQREADFASLEIVSSPAHGSVTIDRLTGQILFQHNGDGAASDIFAYRVRTRAGTWSQPADVLVSIQPLPNAGYKHAPRALSDAATVTTGQAVQVDVAANDAAPAGAINRATVRIVQRPGNGVATANADGTITYSHLPDRPASDRLTYRVASMAGVWSNEATLFITVQPLPALTGYAAWNATATGAGNAPSANTDGDLFDDLLEYALGGDPNSGANPGGEMWLELAGDSISFVYRRAIGREGLEYGLETSTDLTNWSQPALAPPLRTNNPDGTETVRHQNIQSAAGLTPRLGFARLRVTLDQPAAVSRCLPLGWYARDIVPGYNGFSASLRQPAVFAAKVTATSINSVNVQGNVVLDPAETFVVEVLDGAHAGHRFGIDAATSAGNFIAVDVGSPFGTQNALPNLTGSRVAIVPLWRVKDLFDKNAFRGSTNIAAADHLQFYVNDGAGRETFQSLFLLDARPQNATFHWRLTNGTPGDQGERPLVPGEGLFIKRRGTAPLQVRVLGQVRGNPFVQPLKKGHNLVGEPFPVPQTPATRQMTASEFTASTNISLADKIQVINPSGTFTSYYYLDLPTVDEWRRTSGAGGNQNNAPIFSRDSATFIRRATSPLPAYTIR